MRRIKIAALTAVRTVSMAAPAHAYFDAWYSDAARATASGTVVKAYDIRCDGQSVQANWLRGGSSTVYEKTNSGGCGTVLEARSLSTVIQLRACMVVAAQPDPCGPWDYSG